MDITTFFKNKKDSKLEINNVEVKKYKPHDLIPHLTYKKTAWVDLSGEQRKVFNPFIINRILSRNPILAIIIASLQKYTLNLEAKQAYKMYLVSIPKKDFNLPYIGDNTIKYNKKVVECVAKWYEVSTTQAINYIEAMSKTQLMQLCEGFGLDKKTVKQLLKNK